jgi:DNA polymerase III subunit epsilon
MSDKKFDLAFTDCETTGLDPNAHEIIEIAIIRIDPYTMTEKARFHRYFLPFLPPSEEVKKINGYDEKVWRERGAKHFHPQDLREISVVLEGAAFAGQNPGFDRGFIRATYAVIDLNTGKPRVDFPAMDYHLIDVASLAWPFVVAGLMPGMGLKHSRKYFGLEGEQTHGALQDILDTINSYRKFMEIYMAAATVEDLDRNPLKWKDIIK